MMFGLPEPIQPVVFSFSLEAANSRPEMIEMGRAASASKSARPWRCRRRGWRCLHLVLQIPARHRETKSGEDARASETDLGENGDEKGAAEAYMCGFLA